MDEKMLKILRSIPIGSVILEATKGKQYIYTGVKEYCRHGKSPELDGELIAVLKSESRKRGEINLFLSTVSYFLIDGVVYLGYGKLPPAYLKYRMKSESITANAIEYESHYKSLAKHLYRLNSYEN